MAIAQQNADDPSSPFYQNEDWTPPDGFQYNGVTWNGGQPTAAQASRDALTSAIDPGPSNSGLPDTTNTAGGGVNDTRMGGGPGVETPIGTNSNGIGWTQNPDGTYNLPPGYQTAPSINADGTPLATPSTPAPAPAAPPPAGAASSSGGTTTGAGNWQSGFQSLFTGGGPVNQATVDALNQKFGTAGKYYNDSRGEFVGFPTGYYTNGPNGWQWSARGPETGGGGGATAPVPTGSGGGISLGGGGTTSGPLGTIGTGGSSPTDQYNTALRAFMLQQLGTLSTPTTATSPDIAPAIGAYDTQSRRDQQQERDALAERFYAMGSNGGGGLDSGGFNKAVQQGSEAAAGNRANFSGNMVYQAAQQKRQQLQSMLQTASMAGLTDQAAQIQQQIAIIDAKLREQGLTQQNSQFGDQLGFSYANLEAQLNRDALINALG